MKTNYLVLTDFTESSETALKSALKLAAESGGKVVGLHALSSDNKEAKSLAQKNTRELKSKVSGEYDIQLLVGKLDDLINSSIDLLEIDYVIMGTHGVVGLQNVFGSNALKLVSSSKKPFLITQKDKE